jgi:hypothetical protein
MVSLGIFPIVGMSFKHVPNMQEGTNWCDVKPIQKQLKEVDVTADRKPCVKHAVK